MSDATKKELNTNTQYEDEPLLRENTDRFVLFPLKYPQIWEMYKRAEEVFWTFEELDLSADKHDWDNKLKEEERHFLKHILGFFAGSDGIVMENLACRFMKEIQIPEARAFYAFQIAIETIHSETYSELINTYITDNDEKNSLFSAIETLPCVKKKAEWAIRWMNESAPFAQRLIAFAIVEGIFFSSSFCSIYWIKKRGLLSGLTLSNEFISRDEGMHTDFACLLYSMMQRRIPVSIVRDMIKDAVAIEKEFILDAISCDLIGMNTTMMSTYIEYVADRLLVQLGYERLWNSENPFDFMILQSLENKANFFEKRVSNYIKSGASNNKKRRLEGRQSDGEHDKKKPKSTEQTTLKSNVPVILDDF
jgi:ribonucleotide reductase beta subunit family protein with ferritin-like domain